MTSKKVKVSVCVTTKNESEETIKKLLDALNHQSLKPDEIIIIDAKDYNNCSRSEGRNLAIKKARNEIIVITDAGCVPRKDWLKNLTVHIGGAKAHPLGVLADVVAGGYKMIAKNSFQKAMRFYLGVSPRKFDKNFMPSARSMAFTKTIWKKAGGFPEKLSGAAEDTLFNVNLIKAGAKFVTAKNAVVEWGMPTTIFNFFVKDGFFFLIFNYAVGDGQAGIWWHPVKRFQSHNIKILSIYPRYIIGLLLLVLSFKFSVFALLLYILITLYLLYSYKKAGIYGPILQLVSDIAVMTGFIRGIMWK